MSAGAKEMEKIVLATHARMTWRVPREFSRYRAHGLRF